MMDVYILGSTGMAGHIISKELEKNKNLNIINVSRNEHSLIKTHLFVNFSDKKKVDKLIKRINQSKNDVYIINCLGILNKDAEKNIINSYKINSIIPSYILRKIKNNVKLIHISTTEVFDGKSNRKYNEVEITNPEKNIYSKSKNLGEILLNEEENKNYIILRTSIIGPDIKEGIGLFDWFVLNKEKEIEGYNKSIWSGVTTLELSKIINIIINNNLFNELPKINHLSNNISISKNDLLEIINKYLKDKKNIIKIDGKKQDKSIINSYPYLEVSNYEKMIKELVDWIIKNDQKIYDSKYEKRFEKHER